MPPRNSSDHYIVPPDRPKSEVHLKHICHLLLNLVVFKTTAHPIASEISDFLQLDIVDTFRPVMSLRAFFKTLIFSCTVIFTIIVTSAY